MERFAGRFAATCARRSWADLICRDTATSRRSSTACSKAKAGSGVTFKLRLSEALLASAVAEFHHIGDRRSAASRMIELLRRSVASSGVSRERCPGGRSDASPVVAPADDLRIELLFMLRATEPAGSFFQSRRRRQSRKPWTLLSSGPAGGAGRQPAQDPLAPRQEATPNSRRKARLKLDASTKHQHFRNLAYGRSWAVSQRMGEAFAQTAAQDVMRQPRPQQAIGCDRDVAASQHSMEIARAWRSVDASSRPFRTRSIKVTAMEASRRAPADGRRRQADLDHRLYRALQMRHPSAVRG